MLLIVVGLGAFVAAAATSCDTTVHRAGAGGADAAVPPTCLEAVDHSDLPWISENVFRTSCASFSSCHMGQRPAGLLNLTTNRAYEQLVNVEAKADSTWMRVVPGDPEHSYIMVKLGAVEGKLGEKGTLMPPNSPPICAEKIAAVERWIREGALRAPVDAGVDAAGEEAVDATTEINDAGATD